MFVIIGILAVFGAVLGGFLMEKGPLLFARRIELGPDENGWEDQG